MVERRGHLGNLADNRIELVSPADAKMSGGAAIKPLVRLRLPKLTHTLHFSAGVWYLGYLSDTFVE